MPPFKRWHPTEHAEHTTWVMDGLRVAGFGLTIDIKPTGVSHCKVYHGLMDDCMVVKHTKAETIERKHWWRLTVCYAAYHMLINYPDAFPELNEIPAEPSVISLGSCG